MALQVEEDERFQQRDWQAQRIAWVLIGVFVLAAALGVFGPGPLSYATAESEDGALVVEYLRFARRGGAGDMTVTAAQGLVVDGQLTIRLPSSYLAAFTVENVSPQPAEVRVVGDMVEFVVPVAAIRDRVPVTFSLTPDAMGALSGVVDAGASARVPVSHFLYP